ncbi:hypothetical protein Tco_1410170 [Tanacetum coccineum]
MRLLLVAGYGGGVRMMAYDGDGVGCDTSRGGGGGLKVMKCWLRWWGGVEWRWRPWSGDEGEGRGGANTNDVKDSELASLFGKLKYEENLIDNSPDDEEDTRSSQEYMNDLEMEFHERALLAKSKSSSQQKLELRPTKDFEAKYNKVKAKLALLSSGASTSKSSRVRKQGLEAEAYEWDEDVDVGKESARNNEWVKITMRKFKVNQCISKQIPNQKKRILGVDQLTKDPSSFGKKDLVFVKSSADDTNVSIPNVERAWLFEAEGLTCLIMILVEFFHLNHNTPLPPLEKLAGAEPVSAPKTIKSILKSNSRFKADTLKGVTINDPTSAPAKGNKNVLASKKNSAPAGKLKNVKLKMTFLYLLE